VSFDVTARYFEEILLDLKKNTNHTQLAHHYIQNVYELFFFVRLFASWSEYECLWGCWSTLRVGWKVNGIQEFPGQGTLESW